MKNKELIVKFAPVARKNLNKTFFTLFIIVILESLCSALFVGTSLLLNSMQDSFAVTFFSYSLMFCGVFFWFLILSGFATMLLRMARDEFVTIGFLFYGFRRFKQFAPAAFLYTLLTGISAAVVAGTMYFITKSNPDFIVNLQSKFGENAFLYLLIVFSFILVFLLIFPQVFLFFLKYDNPNRSVFSLAFLSSKLLFKNIFKFIGFVFMAGGRNLILAAFYFGITLSFSAAQKGGVIQFFSLIFDFLYFINFYKALSLMSLAVPFFYENLRQPAVEILVSLKKNDDEILLENKNPDKNNPDGQ